MTNKQETIEELEIIQAQMLELVEQLRQVVRGTDADALARSYVIPTLAMSISDDHEWTGQQVSIDSLIKAINEEV